MLEMSLKDQAAGPGGWVPKKTGLNHNDVNVLVGALKAGASWQDAKKPLAQIVAPEVLEAWKAECFAKADRLEELQVAPLVDDAAYRAPPARDVLATPAPPAKRKPAAKKKGAR